MVGQPLHQLDDDAAPDDGNVVTAGVASSSVVLEDDVVVGVLDGEPGNDGVSLKEGGVVRK